MDNTDAFIHLCSRTLSCSKHTINDSNYWYFIYYLSDYFIILVSESVCLRSSLSIFSIVVLLADFYNL